MANYQNKNKLQPNKVKNQTDSVQTQKNLKIKNAEQIAFKGGLGASLGIFGGAALGALTTAAIIATGGLAGVVAAVGYTSTVAAGAGCCTHAGGIIGSIIEDNL